MFNGAQCFYLFLYISTGILCAVNAVNAVIIIVSRIPTPPGKSWIFSVRQHAERAICYRKSVCPSVTWVDQSKTVEVRIMQFSPYSSLIP